MAGQQAAPSALDDIAADLQRLRTQADVSYAEIAARISARREADGASPAAARVARSTVFDVFRTGRARINATLVGEIVVALGGTADDAEQWSQRCRTAKPAAPVAPLPDSTPLADPRDAALRATLVPIILVACILLNFGGAKVNAFFEIPLFLDMIGSAIAAFVLGPWQAVVVSIVSHAAAAVVGPIDTLWFVLVGIAGALVWGYGIRRFASTPLRFFALTILVALVCTLVGVPINVLMYDGFGHHSGDALVVAMRASESIWLSVFSINFLVSIIDKLIAAVIGFIVAKKLAWLRLGPELPLFSAELQAPRTARESALVPGASAFAPPGS